MNHADHVRLLHDGIPAAGGVWADLGSGTGAFTLALADLIGTGGTIYSVDRDQGALKAQEQAIRARFPNVTVHYRVADFTRPLDLPPLDGIVMANALHYVPPRHKVAVVRQIKGYLRPGGRLIVVEYNVDSGNLWVPHPFSYPTWDALAQDSGFTHTEQLATAPSHFLTGFYSAVSW